jgi:hypothetical protein
LYFKDNIPDGLRTDWHRNGKKSYECSYKDGKRDGLHTEWDENGQKKNEGSYKDGKNMSPSVLEAIDDLKKYAKALVVKSKNNIFTPEVEESYFDNYVIRFQTSDSNLMLDYFKDNNLKMVDLELAWGEKFCTPELKSIIYKHSIKMVTGHFLDDKKKLSQIMLLCSNSSK